MSKRECEFCGIDISGRREGAKYCSRNCKGGAAQDRRRGITPEQRAARRKAGGYTDLGDCVECGARFEYFRTGGPKRQRCNACNPSYIICSLCGIRCRPNPGEIHCVNCRIELNRIADDGPTERVAECEPCGKPFVQTSGSHRFCSRRCADSKRVSNWNNRRFERYGVTPEKFLAVEIYERDGWICKLCDIPVNPKAEVPHPFAPTQDHIIPLHKGGQHTRENVQLAHFYCNSVKQDQEEPEQRLGVSEPVII